MPSITSETSFEKMTENSNLIEESHDVMKHLWIIEKFSSRLVYYRDFNSGVELDGMLLSGLLSALNHFSEFELAEKGIESIDMGDLRWVYNSFAESNLLLVGAASKKSNPKLLLSRLEVIHKMFVQEFDIQEDFWNTWDSVITPFKKFDETTTLLHTQWVEANKNMDVGKIFDLLGVFQQLFIHLIQIIEYYFKGVNYSTILKQLQEYKPHLERWHHHHAPSGDTYRVFELFIPHINLDTKAIEFSKAPATNLFGLNPIGLDDKILRALFFIVLRHFTKILKHNLGEITWLQVTKSTIQPYLFKNWDFLSQMHLLKDLMFLFWR